MGRKSINTNYGRMLGNQYWDKKSMEERGMAQRDRELDQRDRYHADDMGFKEKDFAFRQDRANVGDQQFEKDHQLKRETLDVNADHEERRIGIQDRNSRETIKHNAYMRKNAADTLAEKRKSNELKGNFLGYKNELDAKKADDDYNFKSADEIEKGRVREAGIDKTRAETEKIRLENKNLRTELQKKQDQNEFTPAANKKPKSTRY